MYPVHCPVPDPVHFLPDTRREGDKYTPPTLPRANSPTPQCLPTEGISSLPYQPRSRLPTASPFCRSLRELASHLKQAQAQTLSSLSHQCTDVRASMNYFHKTLTSGSCFCFSVISLQLIYSHIHTKPRGGHVKNVHLCFSNSEEQKPHTHTHTHTRKTTTTKNAKTNVYISFQ